MVLSVVVAGRPPQYTARSGCTYYLLYTSRQRPQEGTRRPESAPQFPGLPVAAAGEDTALKLPVGHLALPVWSSRLSGPSPSMRESHDSIRPVAPSRAPTLVWLDTFAPGFLMLCRFPRNSRINSAPTFQGSMHRHSTVRGRRPRGHQASLSPTNAGLGHPSTSNYDHQE